ncbi:MAG TPA: hypothetical protein VGM57_18025 [Pseudolabrys sp.]|jgi:hypothetical protein
MGVTSIGVQTIMPRTGTSPKTTSTHEANEREAAAAPVEAVQSAPPPPPPGQGKNVDKYV